MVDVRELAFTFSGLGYNHGLLDRKKDQWLYCRMSGYEDEVLTRRHVPGPTSPSSAETAARAPQSHLYRGLWVGMYLRGYERNPKVIGRRGMPIAKADSPRIIPRKLGAMRVIAMSYGLHCRFYVLVDPIAGICSAVNIAEGNVFFFPEFRGLHNKLSKESDRRNSLHAIINRKLNACEINSSSESPEPVGRKPDVPIVANPSELLDREQDDVMHSTSVVPEKSLGPTYVVVTTRLQLLTNLYKRTGDVKLVHEMSRILSNVLKNLTSVNGTKLTTLEEPVAVETQRSNMLNHDTLASGSFSAKPQGLAPSKTPTALELLFDDSKETVDVSKCIAEIKERWPNLTTLEIQLGEIQGMKQLMRRHEYVRFKMHWEWVIYNSPTLQGEDLYSAKEDFIRRTFEWYRSCKDIL